MASSSLMRLQTSFPGWEGQLGLAESLGASFAVLRESSRRHGHNETRKCAIGKPTKHARTRARPLLIRHRHRHRQTNTPTTTIEKNCHKNKGPDRDQLAQIRGSTSCSGKCPLRPLGSRKTCGWRCISLLGAVFLPCFGWWCRSFFWFGNENTPKMRDEFGNDSFLQPHQG